MARGGRKYLHLSWFLQLVSPKVCVRSLSIPFDWRRLRGLFSLVIWFSVGCVVIRSRFEGEGHGPCYILILVVKPSWTHMSLFYLVKYVLEKQLLDFSNSTPAFYKFVEVYIPWGRFGILLRKLVMYQQNFCFWMLFCLTIFWFKSEILVFHNSMVKISM